MIRTLFLVVETTLLLASAPLLLFPTAFPQGTLAALVLSALWWGGRCLLAREPLPLTPLNGVMLCWAIAVGVGASITAFPAITLPKATGLLLGFAVWRYLVIVVADRGWLRLATAAFMAVGVVIAIVGILSAKWYTKVPLVGDVIALLPSRLLTLPEAPEAGVSANQLAGALVVYLPLALAGVLAAFPTPLGSGQVRRKEGGTPRWQRYALLLIAAVGFLALLGLLILTQSRSGWVGGIVGLSFFLGAWALTSRWRARFVAVGLALVVLAVVVGLSVMQLDLANLLEGQQEVETEVAGRVSLAGRVEIWSRALYAIQDFPFTGCGLGTFREVVWILYPLFTMPPDVDISHAHNIFLQVALDTGIPGLIAYLALLIVAAQVAWRVALTQPELRVLALGLLGGLVALHVYGLTDALAPGSKPSFITWWVLGLLAVMGRGQHSHGFETPA